MTYTLSEIYITICFIMFGVLALAIQASNNRNRWDYVVAVLLSVFWPATIGFYFYQLYKYSKRDN